jgi:hypothetical protein
MSAPISGDVKRGYYACDGGMRQGKREMTGALKAPITSPGLFHCRPCRRIESGG